MNSCNFLGRLTKDIEVVSASTTVAKFSLAVDRKFKKEGQPSADFPRFVAFGKTAEIMAQYLTKGSQIAVTGRLQTGSYEKEGQRVYTTDIIVESFSFAGNSEKQEPRQAPQKQKPAPQQDSFNGFQAIDGDDSIPF